MPRRLLSWASIAIAFGLLSPLPVRAQSSEENLPPGRWARRGSGGSCRRAAGHGPTRRPCRVTGLRRRGGLGDLHEDSGDKLHRVDPLRLLRLGLFVSRLRRVGDLVGAGRELQPGAPRRSTSRCAGTLGRGACWS